MIRVRAMRADESAALYAILYRAVHEGAAGHYAAAEREAWAPSPTPPEDWPGRLLDQITLVAEAREEIAGFMTLGRDGHLDLAYVLPEVMGQGVAAALHDRVIAEAQALGLTRLDTEASHLARRFFLRQGWREIAAQDVERNGVKLRNFRMEKRVALRR